MIALLTTSGLILLWITHLTDAITKHKETFVFKKWIQDEMLSIIITTIIAFVGVVLISTSISHTGTIDIQGVQLRSDYAISFLVGYAGTAFLSRLVSIGGNI